MGICADTLYRTQTIWFGSTRPCSVVVSKMLFDQLVYTPLFGTPAIIWAYEWRRSGFCSE
jgi:hypothetical protein